MRRYLSAALVASLVLGMLLQSGLALAAGCDDYLTQAEAQARLREDPSDPEGLDPDGNGIACDRNPQPYDRTPVARPGISTPTPMPTATPASETPAPSEATPAPSDDGTALPAASATATPGVRSPLLGPAPPPLIYLQGGAPPPYTRPAPTAVAGSSATPKAGGLAYVQGSDTSIGPVVIQRALGEIQPPNTGDGGLIP